MSFLQKFILFFFLFRLFQILFQLLNPNDKSPINILNKYMKYWYYSPSFAFENYLLKKNIFSNYYIIESSNSFTKSTSNSSSLPLTLTYRVLGKGKRVFLLSNGVGTGLFMWCLVFIYILEYFDPELFSEKITLILPSHRGLYNKRHEELDDDNKKKNKHNIDHQHLEVKLDLCASDIFDVLKHFSSLTESNKFNKVEVSSLIVNDIEKYPVKLNHLKKESIIELDGFIGWSTGAMIALRFVSFFPEIPKKLFLLNPAIGSILSYIFQPFYPLPCIKIRKFLENLILKVLSFLISIIPTVVFDILRNGLLLNNDSCIHYYDGTCSEEKKSSCLICSHLTSQFKFKNKDEFVVPNQKPPIHSYFLNSILFVFAVLGGSPVFQSIFFMDYLNGSLRSRTHTEALLKLLVALNEEITDDQLKNLQNYKKKVYLIGGNSDFLTGIYHLNELKTIFPNVYNKNIFSATHFLIIEYPELLSYELLKFFNDN